MSTADASSGWSALSCLSSTISRVSARAAAVGDRLTGDVRSRPNLGRWAGRQVSGQQVRARLPPPTYPPVLEREPEAEPREPRADPEVRDCRSWCRTIRYAGALPLSIDALVVQVEEIQIDAHAARRIAAERERLLDAEVDVVDRDRCAACRSARCGRIPIPASDRGWSPRGPRRGRSCTGRPR